MGQEIRQVVGFGDWSTGRGNFGANLGRPIVTNRDFAARTCAKVREPSELLFGVVRGVGRGSFTPTLRGPDYNSCLYIVTVGRTN